MQLNIEQNLNFISNLLNANLQALFYIDQIEYEINLFHVIYPFALSIKLLQKQIDKLLKLLKILKVQIKVHKLN